MEKVEILAPASSYEGLQAAICAGCDAVYVGGSQFNARAFANNLDEEQMLWAIDYAHIHKKHLYLTLNTLLKQRELEEKLYLYLEKYYKQGLDAVIVQDIGVLSFIHNYFPSLPIHISTQMMLTSADEANLLKNYGVTRIVPSRELSIEELKILRQNTDLEIEIFIHGALCYSYSGQCLMSSLIGGRSGNRGRCAQPCRKPYSFSKKEAYFLSLKDLCTLSILPDLIETGVNSFKIEGRMKRPEYAALTSYIYQKYTQLYYENGKANWEEQIKEDKKKLLDLYNRGGFTTGYYFLKNGKQMMSFERPNHNGILIGKVVSVCKIKASILLYEGISSYDILEFREGQKVLYCYTVKQERKKGETVDTNVSLGTNIKKGVFVYRIKNQNLLEELEKEYLKKQKKEEIKGVFFAKANEIIELTLYCREFRVTVKGEMAQLAKNQPITEERVRKQLEKIQDTPFIFKTLQIQMEKNLFFPIGKLNELRREAILELKEAICSPYKREAPFFPIQKAEEEENRVLKTDIGTSVFTKSQWEICLLEEKVNVIYYHMEYLKLEEIAKIAKKTNEKGKKFYLLLPYILREEYIKEWKEKQDIFADKNIYGFIIKNLEEYEFVKHYKKEIILDYNMYILNKEAKKFWKKLGVKRYTTSLELNKREIASVGCKDCDFIVYGYLSLMVCAQCLLKNTDQCKKQSKLFTIKDSLKKDFYVKNYCNYCYTILYNGIPLWLFDELKEIQQQNPYRLRLDFTIEEAAETKKVLDDFIDVYCNLKTITAKKSFTKGHFNRGVD